MDLMRRIFNMFHRIRGRAPAPLVLPPPTPPLAAGAHAAASPLIAVLSTAVPPTTSPLEAGEDGGSNDFDSGADAGLAETEHVVGDGFPGMERFDGGRADGVEAGFGSILRASEAATSSRLSRGGSLAQDSCPDQLLRAGAKRSAEIAKAPPWKRARLTAAVAISGGPDPDEAGGVLEKGTGELKLGISGTIHGVEHAAAEAAVLPERVRSPVELGVLDTGGAAAVPHPVAVSGDAGPASCGPGTGEMRCFLCPHCPAFFTVRSDANHHIRVHVRQKPFSCLKCKSSFTRPKDLHRHMMAVHEQLRPYECGLCSARFGYWSNRQRHVRSVHDKGGPYVCNACGASFGSLDNFQCHWGSRHRTSHHSGAGVATLPPSRRSLPPLAAIAPAAAAAALQAVTPSTTGAIVGAGDSVIERVGKLREDGVGADSDSEPKVEAANRGGSLAQESCADQLPRASAKRRAETAKAAPQKQARSTAVTAAVGTSGVPDSEEARGVVEDDTGQLGQGIVFGVLRDCEQVEAAVLPARVPSPVAPGMLDTGGAAVVAPHPVAVTGEAGNVMIGAFSCSLCIANFMARSDVSRHMRVFHKSKIRVPLECTKCAFTCDFPSHMRRHTMSVHDNMRPFACELCNDRFTMKDRLTRHFARRHRATGVSTLSPPPPPHVLSHAAARSLPLPSGHNLQQQQQPQPPPRPQRQHDAMPPHQDDAPLQYVNPHAAHLAPAHHHSGPPRIAADLSPHARARAPPAPSGRHVLASAPDCNALPAPGAVSAAPAPRYVPPFVPLPLDHGGNGDYSGEPLPRGCTPPAQAPLDSAAHNMPHSPEVQTQAAAAQVARYARSLTLQETPHDPGAHDAALAPVHSPVHAPVPRHEI